MDIKNELGNEVRILTKRMSHIDEQISKIHRLLAPRQSSTINQPSPLSTSEEKSLVLIRPPSLTLTAIATPSDVNIIPSKMSPLCEKPSISSDLNPLSSTKSDSADHSLNTSVTRQSSDSDSVGLSNPPPRSVYNRSSNSPILSLGLSTIPRASASNKIAPAAITSSPRPAPNQTFRPVSNTRYHPGRSPKLKSRSFRNRSDAKHQSSSDKSTVIDLESPIENKATPLLSTSKSSGNTSVFRRFLPNPDLGEKSSALLYPPTSDDERPMSPASSGNDDDDHRPLTSSSTKHHHQTLL